MKRLIYLSLIISFAACKPAAYLSKPQDYKFDVHGSYLQVKAEEYKVITGEIIVVEDNSVTVLSVETNELITFNKHQLSSFEVLVSATSDDPAGISGYGFVMGLLSIGHGYYGIISYPINFLSAVAIGVDVASPYVMKYPDSVDWKRLSKFARFPMGLPEGVDINTIR